MTTTSSVSSTSPSVNTGQAQDISNLISSSFGVSIAEAVTVKVQPYLDRATAVQTEINTNQTQIAAYQNMQSLLQALQNSAANLSSQALQGSNVFNNRVANMTATGVVAGVTPSNPSTLLSASVTAGTNLGSHTVVVNQLATAESDISKTLNLSTSAQATQAGTFTIAEATVTGTTKETSSTAALGLSGPFIINGGTTSGGTATPISVAVTSGMSLNDIANAINAAATAAGVANGFAASVNSSNQLQITAGNGNALTFSGDTGNVLSSLGVAGAVPVTITSNMSLNDIASAINSVSSTNGVSASVVSIDSSHSVLVVSGASTATPLTFQDDSSTHILANLGLYSASSTVTGTASQSSSSSALGLSGSFTVNGGVNGSSAATPFSVTVTSGMSLNDIVTAINNAANTAGVVNLPLASVAGTNQLQITSKNSNALTFSNVTGNVLSSLGVPDQATNGAANQVSAAQSASLTVDGVSGITRTTNTVSDVLNGVTLNLQAADPNTQVTLSVAPDTSGVDTTIQSFVTAYNTWQGFVQQNEATTSSGTAAAGAVLFGDSTLREASLQVDSSVTAMVNKMTLADIGITLDSNNNLQINSSTLSQSVTTNFQGVYGLFQSSLTSTSASLTQFGTDYSTYSGSFTLGITTNGSGSITGLNLNNTGNASGAFTFSGNTITGVAGSPYEGISLAYTGSGTGATPITVTGTQGVANQVYTTTNNYANPLSGSIQNQITTQQNNDLNLTSQYNTLVGNANDYTNFLLQQYAQYSTQIQTASQASTTLQALFSSQTGGGHL